MRSKRPRSVTTLTWGVLIFSGIHFVRFVAGLNLPALPFSVPPWYYPLTGAIWGLLGAAGAFGLFRARRWAPDLLRGGSIVYAAWLWLDRIFVVEASYATGKLLMTAFFTLLGLAFIFWTLWRAEAQSFFSEAGK